MGKPRDMNILFDGRPLADKNSGGVKRVASGIVEALKKQNESITVITTGTKRLPSSDQHLGLPNKFISLILWLHLTSLDRLFKHNADLLLLPNIGWLGTPKIPYALIVHDLSFLIEPKWFSWKSRIWHYLINTKKQIQNAKILFAVSEHTKRDLIRLLNISPSHIVVIPLGLDSKFQASSFKLQAPPPYLLALGAKDPRKNAALSHTVAKETGLELKLIGDKNLGRVTDKQLAELYAHATVFLYPSWYEGFGLPLHEAAMYETPCIASTAGALPETAPQGTVFASPAKPQHWIQAIKTIQKNPSLYKTTTTLSNWEPAARQIIRSLEGLPIPPHQA